MGEEGTETNLAVAIKQELNKLRRSPEIRKYVRDARQALKEGLSMKPADDLPKMYEKVVFDSLHYLAEEHLRAYFEDKFKGESKAAIILLSYSSLLKQPNRRVMDLEPDHLSGGDETLRTHIKNIISEKWVPISKRRERLEIHRLAQRPVSPRDGVPQRIPIYISAFEIKWPEDLIVKGHFIYKIHDEENPVGAYIHCPLSDVDPALPTHRLRKFVQCLARSQFDQNDRYPIADLPTEEYLSYVDYIRELLLLGTGPTPLCLCTIAISDDLSDVPLGTAMIFSERVVSPEVATGIREICFDVFNAFYKIESEAYSRRQSSLLLANWVNHEAKNWAAGIRNLAEALENNAQKSGGHEYVLETGEDLKALATTIPLTTELLRQINLNADPKPLAEFNHEVIQILRAIISKQSTESYHCAIDADLRVPRGLLMICMELIRNVQKHNNAAPSTDLKIRVELEKKNGSLVLTVTSSPHNEAFTESDLTRLNSEKASTLRLAGNKLGGKLIKNLVEIMGGSIRWDWERIRNGENSIAVKATCEIPLMSDQR